MSKPLDVAFEIADAVRDSAENRRPLNVPAVAAEIASRHPSATSYQEVVEVLEEERRCGTLMSS